MIRGIEKVYLVGKVETNLWSDRVDHETGSAKLIQTDRRARAKAACEAKAAKDGGRHAKVL